MTKRSFITTLILTLVSLLLLTGCTVTGEKKAATTQKPELAVPNAQVEGSLDSGFPSTLPLWPGAQVVASKHTDKGDFDIYDLVLRTTDNYDEVVYGYAEGLRQAGFTVEQVDQSDSLKVVTATSEEVSAYITFTVTDDQKTEVTASIQL